MEVLQRSVQLVLGLLAVGPGEVGPEVLHDPGLLLYHELEVVHLVAHQPLGRHVVGRAGARDITCNTISVGDAVCRVCPK